MLKDTCFPKIGCVGCCPDIFAHLPKKRRSPEDILQRRKSKEIDKFLTKDEYSFRRQVKLLLLGAGESGKSTFLKQMRIIHGLNFDTDLLDEYRIAIYQNVIRGIQVLIDAREKLNICWENSDLEDYTIKVKSISCIRIEADTFKQYVPYIKRLWQDRSIREAYDRRREYQISDSVRYFLDELERLSNLDYIPNHKDILHCRKATKSVYELCITIQSIPFVFIDVGGQRTQRQKWTKCFGSAITSIIFFVSSSEFDQVLAEDRTTNRLEESKNIFDTIVNNNTFNDISIILFLNKTDILEQKLRMPETNFLEFYPEFKGSPQSTLDVQNFILNMFLSVRKGTPKRTYHHFTNAVDTRNIRFVFNSVKATILHRNLNALMLE